MLFHNCFCPSPICVPSRSSQLSARYPQELNTVSNPAFPFPSGTVTFPEILAGKGYYTVNYGKWHTLPHPIWQASEELRHFRHYAFCEGLGEGYREEDYGVINIRRFGGLILSGSYPGGEDTPSRYITDRGIEFLHNHDGEKPFLLRISHSWPHTPILPPPPFGKLYQPDDIPIRYFDEAAYLSRSRRDRRWADLFGLKDLDRDTP